MILAWLSVVGLALSALAAMMFAVNLPLYTVSDSIDSDEDASRPVGDDRPSEFPLVSVLIPARDEEAGIEACIGSVLASKHVVVEIIVLDDHSSDSTGLIIDRIAEHDSRVRRVMGQPLPEGWNGKQYACWQLSHEATHQRILFLDADVRLHPAAIAKLIRYQEKNQVAILSTFPFQELETWLEKWLIPMMHYILLCYLPISRMRNDNSPAFASGCGQLFLTGQTEYLLAGTHQAIRSSRHDGLKLPRAYRNAGMNSDVIDGTELASCRMYRSTTEVVRGALKNATEGIANAKLIFPFTVLLIGGSVLPIVVAIAAAYQSRWGCLMVGLIGVGLGHWPRWGAAAQFRQPLIGVIFHSAAVTTFIVLQWIAMAQAAMGYQIQWRGRI